jgi:hypothetical protein
MASSKSTIYDVSVLYKMDDRASGALADLAKNAGAAESRVMGVKEALLGIGAALGGRALLGFGKEAFIDFNSNVEQAKLGIAAVTKMFNENVSFDDAMRGADKLFDHYQQVAKQSAGTTMDFVNMHKMLAPSLEAAGASLNDFKTIVQGAVTTAPIAGYNAEMASLEMKQMMAGTIGGKDHHAHRPGQDDGQAVQRKGQGGPPICPRLPGQGVQHGRPQASPQADGKHL